jgi:hypothetical protein
MRRQRLDPLRRHWAHTVIVRRLLGEGPGGSVYGQTIGEPCAVDDTTRMVLSPTGVEVVSSSTVSFPTRVEFIPVGSTVSLPQKFGGRTAKVVASKVADAGDELATPNHSTVHLE